MMFELLLDVMDRFLNLRDSVFVFEISSLQSSYRCSHLHESHRTLRDGFWGGAVPGTSCQATIAPSLRDISQQALAKACCENGCYFLGLAAMRRSLFKAASSRKRFWS